MARLKRLWNVVYNVLVMPEHVMGRPAFTETAPAESPRKPAFHRVGETQRVTLEPGDPGHS